MRVSLKRILDTGRATLGYVSLFLPAGQAPIFTAGTLEPPWKENQKNMSCISAGIYELENFWSEKFRLTTVSVNDLPGQELLGSRHGIIFHPGNTRNDTEGCILIGAGLIFEPPSLEASRSATYALLELVIPELNKTLEIAYV